MSRILCSGFQKYVPIDSRLSFRTHHGSIWSVLWLAALKLKNSTSLCSGLKQLQFLRSASPRTLNQISPNEFARKLRRCIQSLKRNVFLRTTIKSIYYLDFVLQISFCWGGIDRIIQPPRHKAQSKQIHISISTLRIQ